MLTAYTSHCAQHKPHTAIGTNGPTLHSGPMAPHCNQDQMRPCRTDAPARAELQDWEWYTQHCTRLAGGCAWADVLSYNALVLRQRGWS